jgi:hypothetical protein
MKKLARYALIAVLVAWIISDPASAAALAHKLTAMFGEAARSLSTLASGL